MANIDIKKIADKIIDSVGKDPKLISNLTKDPIKVVEKLTGIDLPDEKVGALIKEVKTKLSKVDTKKLDAAKIEKGLELLNSFTGSKTGKKKDGVDINDLAEGVKTLSKLLKK